MEWAASPDDKSYLDSKSRVLCGLVLVSERLYCAAYGCALRSRNSQALRALAAYVYRVVFEDKRPPANILLRDYAKGMIEYALHRKIALNIRRSPMSHEAVSDRPVCLNV
jgi:hypothetical protein